MTKSTNVTFYIFDFRQDMICAQEKNRQTGTETDKSMAIGEIL